MREYRPDLAYIHDAGFGFHARHAAALLLAELKRFSMHAGRVVELGCGSGILSEQVADAGYDVMGIDISPAMIALARERVPHGRFRVQSLWDAVLPQCIAVAAVGEIVNFRFDHRSTPRALAKLLQRIHAALVPGGILLLDAAGPGRAGGSGRRKNWMQGDDWAVQVETEEDARRKLLTRRITSFRKAGELYRRDDEVHCLQLYPPAKLATTLRQTGFRVRRLQGYGRLRFPQGLTGFLAQRARQRTS